MYVARTCLSEVSKCEARMKRASSTATYKFIKKCCESVRLVSVLMRMILYVAGIYFLIHDF